MIIDTFALLCGLAVATFSATARSVSALGWWLTGYVTAAIAINPAMLGLDRQPLLGFDASQFAMLILLVSCWILNDQKRAAIPLFMAGFLSVTWVSALKLQGLPLPAGITVAACISLLSIGATLKLPGFSNRVLEDEANFLVLGFALILVVLPPTLAGWESAASLQDRGSRLSAYQDDVPAVLIVSGLFIVLGGCYARWKQR